MPVAGPSAADAEAMLLEVFVHCWCDRGEALAWSLLFAGRAHDERQAIEARRAAGERDVCWDEVIQLQAWSWLAREAAAGKFAEVT